MDRYGSAGLNWRKSELSSMNGNCVEICQFDVGSVAVRDSKDNAAGPVLVFGAQAWRSFLSKAKAGRFDS